VGGLSDPRVHCIEMAGASGTSYPVSCPILAKGSRSGFSLLELIVVISITSLLAGLLMPALSSVRENARRVMCGANQRQIGQALTMFSSDRRNRLPVASMLDFARARSWAPCVGSQWIKTVEHYDGKRRHAVNTSSTSKIHLGMHLVIYSNGIIATTQIHSSAQVTKGSTSTSAVRKKWESKNNQSTAVWELSLRWSQRLANG